MLPVTPLIEREVPSINPDSSRISEVSTASKSLISNSVANSYIGIIPRVANIPKALKLRLRALFIRGSVIVPMALEHPGQRSVSTRPLGHATLHCGHLSPTARRLNTPESRRLTEPCATAGIRSPIN